MLDYLKCAKALLDSAILWVSSFFFTAAPSPLDAAMISAANFSPYPFPFLALEYLISHFMPTEILRAGLIS
jgi:hypothetical protein